MRCLWKNHFRRSNNTLNKQEKSPTPNRAGDFRMFHESLPNMFLSVIIIDESLNGIYEHFLYKFLSGSSRLEKIDNGHFQDIQAFSLTISLGLKQSMKLFIPLSLGNRYKKIALATQEQAELILLFNWQCPLKSTKLITGNHLHELMGKKLLTNDNFYCPSPASMTMKIYQHIVKGGILLVGMIQKPKDSIQNRLISVWNISRLSCQNKNSIPCKTNCQCRS